MNDLFKAKYLLKVYEENYKFDIKIPYDVEGKKKDDAIYACAEECEVWEVKVYDFKSERPLLFIDLYKGVVMCINKNSIPKDIRKVLKWIEKDIMDLDYLEITKICEVISRNGK